MSLDHISKYIDRTYRNIIERDQMGIEREPVTIARLIDLYELRAAWEYDMFNLGETTDESNNNSTKRI